MSMIDSEKVGKGIRRYYRVHGKEEHSLMSHRVIPSRILIRTGSRRREGRLAVVNQRVGQG